MSIKPLQQRAKVLSATMRDLEGASPWRGIIKVAIGIIAFIACIAIALQPNIHPILMGLSMIGLGLTVAYTLIVTHDAIHHTLTGWVWFDEIVPRILSAHIFWFHGVYAELHKLHHHMNGFDPRDPERTMWTVDEYRAAGPFGKFWARNQIMLEVFFGCGLFKIWENLHRIRRLPQVTTTLKKQLALDLALIAIIQSFWITLSVQNGYGVMFIVLFFAGERLGGGILRLRDHVEHYGLAGHGAHYFATQALNSRNHPHVPALISRYFNRLNFHGIHHAFARIPFYELPEGHRRLAAVMAEEGISLPEGKGYWATTWHFIKNPVLLEVKPSGKKVPEMTVIPLRSVA